MLKICLAFWKSERQYANKRYAYIKKTVWRTSKAIFVDHGGATKQ